ncbi:NACHT domain-containing protein [Novosphingobium sp. Chol11]|uniref:NACHT domain-containing protein n=1 Tax=Novosphingobium sp. Chol11 TaxID=1385763 RepID=UPI000BE372A1|nr:pentapeptide repeat-containing protein [Novosphingobium sp. Chol11]
MHNVIGAEVGVHLPLDISVESEWKDFLGSVGGAISDLFLKSTGDGVSTGISGLVKFATSFKIKPSAGYLAWVFAISATAWSLDQSKAFPSDKTDELVKHFRHAIDTARAKCGIDGIFVPINFFDRPTKLQIYNEILEHLFDNDAYSTENKANLRYKIDAAFNRAVFEIFSARPDYYEPLFSSLKIPGALAADISTSWQSYRAKLIYDFEVRPLFGQEIERISLSQLYVPLRGIFSKDDDDIDSEGYNIISSHEMVRIDSELDTWVESESLSDWLRLVGGGPGSGKSTTLKALASRAAKKDGVRPLFIPLQHIGTDQDLREAINRHFTETTDSPFNQPPLARASVEDGAPLLLIFDGLDELVAPGEAAKDVVGTFANRLNSLVSTLTGGNNRKIRVIVSGRMPAFQAASRYLPTPRNGALEAYGFLPVRVHDAGEESDGSDNPLWSEDQRKQWWTQYAALKGETPDIPEAFSNKRLEGITHEPLLCYLLALAGYANQHWELAADNRNRIYSALVESIYERGWGDGVHKRLGAGKTLSKPDFLKLMETIALAAWLGGDARVASEEKFDEALEITEAEDAWKKFTADNGQDVTNLAMNFYLKSSERSQRGFEFTHKSFGEYLAAKALLSVAEDVIAQNLRRIDNAMRDWMRATRTGEPSIEMLHFLRDEIRLKLAGGKKQEEIANAIKLKEGFQNLIKKASDEGFPISGGGTWRSMEVEQANAECALWMVANSCATALDEAECSGKAIIEIEWNDEDELCSVIKRVKDKTGSTVIFSCLSLLDASGQHFEEIRAHNIDFRSSNLEDATFVACDLSGRFNYAIMDGCRFYLCSINSANFFGTSMKGMKFHASSVRGANFDTPVERNLLFSPLTFLSARGVSEEFLKDGASIMAPSKGDFAQVCEDLKRRMMLFQAVPHVIHTGLVGDV